MFILKCCYKFSYIKSCTKFILFVFLINVSIISFIFQLNMLKLVGMTLWYVRLLVSEKMKEVCTEY